MLSEFTQWLADLVTAALVWAWDLLLDLAIAIVSGIGGAIVALLGAIPVPSFLSGGLQSLWGQLDGGILFFVSALGLPQALAMLGTGYAFRLARKVVTLFQW